jgi:hypothetical protein
MDEKRWAVRLAADLAEGHSSLSKARIQQLPGDYRRTLALGLRLKTSNFSTESQSKEYALIALLERIDHPERTRPAFLLRRVGRFAVATVVILAAGILFMALPDIFSIQPSSQPSTSEGQIPTPEALSGSLPEMALRALNLALEKESRLTPPTYDPNERIPTRILELDEALLRDAMVPDEIVERGLDPSAPVWVVRLTGDWLADPPPDPVPEAFYEFQRENHYQYIEVLLDARTGEQVGGVVSYTHPEEIER